MLHKNLIDNCLRPRSFAILLPLLVCVVTFSASRGSSSGAPGDVTGVERRGQSADSSDPATQALREGRAAIASKDWARAVDKFNEIIKLYPQSENVDASLYWLAFALKKQKQPQVAYDTLERLIRDYPRSSWVTDARSLRMEIALTLRKDDLILEEARNSNSDQVKISALHSLFQFDPAEATQIVVNILKPNSNAAPDLKERAAMLLGRYGDRQARSKLLEFINRETDPSIRRRAILSIGMSDDDGALDLLKELAISSTDSDTTEAALVAITAHQSPRAREVLRELARQGITFGSLKRKQ